MNRAEVLEKLDPILETQVRQVEHSPRTRVVVTPDMVTFQPGGGQHHMEMTKAGVESMTKYIGLPWNIAGNLQPGTFGNVATELLSRKNRYSLVTKDGAITGLVKPGQFHNLNAGRVLQTIEGAIRGVEFHRVLILDNYSVSLEVIGEKREAVSRGDLIQAGANISFSPLGTVDPMVQSYVLRLSCTNGQTSNTVLREFHYGGGGGEGDDIWQWFRNSTRTAYNALDRIVTRYRAMMNEHIPAGDRAAMLEAMLREARISGEDANAVRALAIENPPLTSYDVLNLITTATSHIIEDPRKVRRAQLTVASYTSDEEHARVCPVCHTRRN
ncbi:hypothetical protein LCGC14_0732780 [marine sediment metagenome]|uniref:DUF932 domain-containing protein n=1 Tax=marine sediment metagenome TaxID=412755 RepID=A0A0F9QD64_9ZZZZ